MSKIEIGNLCEKLDPSERLDLWAELQCVASHILELTDQWWEEDEGMRIEDDRRCEGTTDCVDSQGDCSDA